MVGLQSFPSFALGNLPEDGQELIYEDIKEIGKAFPFREPITPQVSHRFSLWFLFRYFQIDQLIDPEKEYLFHSDIASFIDQRKIGYKVLIKKKRKDQSFSFYFLSLNEYKTLLYLLGFRLAYSIHFVPPSEVHTLLDVPTHEAKKFCLNHCVSRWNIGSTALAHYSVIFRNKRSYYGKFLTIGRGHNLRRLHTSKGYIFVTLDEDFPFFFLPRSFKSYLSASQILFAPMLRLENKGGAICPKRYLSQD